MSGYIFALGKDAPNDVYRDCAMHGVYSTKMSTISPIPFEGTLADYSTMKAGDNIYFFFQRKIYGIGMLVNILEDCKYSNYPSACQLKKFSYQEVQSDLLIDFGLGSSDNRWLCCFVPSPYFFIKGIDMDDVLTYKPNAFKTLRAFWKTSFVKIGEEENQALKEIIMLRNQDILGNNTLGKIEFQKDTHDNLERRITCQHRIDLSALLRCCCDETYIKHEMAIEAATLHRLSNDDNTLFGRWTHLSHQVPASPFKPIDYMDRIDIFATRSIIGTNIISKYMVMEIKKDVADVDSISQICKYVDWVCKEYAYGDYSAVEGYVLAYGFTKQALEQKIRICKRSYTRGSHPVENRVWNDVKLVKYIFEEGMLRYQKQEDWGE